MHILVLPSWFESDHHPTLGSFFKDQAIALANLGNKVGIIHPTAVSLKAPHLWRSKENHSEQGVNIFIRSYFNYPKLRPLNIQRRIYNFERLFKAYIKKHGMPDILHAHSCALGPFGSAGLAANYLSEKYKIPFVITEHASAFHTGYYQQSDIPLIKRAFEQANTVISVSKALATDLHNFGITRSVEIIGNIIDVNSFTPKNKNEILTSENYTFIVIAYLRPIKNIDLIINAFAVAHKVNKDIRLKIIGNGEQKKALERLTNQLAITTAVSFLGELPRQQVVKQMQQSNCYILASEYETFSVVVHEALAAGLAVVSSRCGGPEESIIATSETLLPETTIESISQAMLEKSRSAKINVLETSRYITENFANDAIGQKLQTILKRSLSNAVDNGSVNG
mgnify:CR=1 FL=1